MDWTMIVMPGNDRGCQWGYLCGKYPGRIASLISPGWWKNPVSFAEYSLDNGAFTGFDGAKFMKLIDKSVKSKKKPQWIAVPDVVSNREETLSMWGIWFPVLRTLGVPLAFVVQDGMTPSDVPIGADVIFVGGSTKWKWRNLKLWTDNFKRVHIGRVNTYRLLWMAHSAGAESCDGTGWFRGGDREIFMLEKYLSETSSSTALKEQIEITFTQ